MNDGDRSLAELLQRAAPEPPTALDFEAVAGRVRRRRRTKVVLTGAGAVLAAVAVVAGTARPDRPQTLVREPPIAGDAGSPTAGTNEPGCPPTRPHAGGLSVQVDYVPFVVLGGRAFIAQLDEVPAMSHSDLGDRIATVSCRIADLTEDGRTRVVGTFPEDYLDGNAAYLQVGTPIYAVDGFDPACRVAVIDQGEVVPYLAHHEVADHDAPLSCALTPSSAPDQQSVDPTRVTVSTHCGVVSVTVDGDLWLADPPMGDNNPPPGWDENRETGTFTVTGDSAEFRTEAGLSATFVRAEPGVPDPGAGCE